MYPATDSRQPRDESLLVADLQRELYAMSDKFCYRILLNILYMDAHMARRMRDIYQHELPVVTDNHPLKGELLDQLGVLFGSYFERKGHIVDLNTSIECLNQAVSLTPLGQNSVDRPARIDHLGSAYGLRFKALGSARDLDKSIECKTEAILHLPATHLTRPALLNTLGEAHRDRFELLGNLQDINEAIDFQMQAVSTSLEDGDKPTRLSSLGASHSRRFEQVGELKDLELSMKFCLEAVSLTPKDDARRPLWLNNFGEAYRNRFERFGEAEDIDNAIACFNEAISSCPKGHSSIPTILSNFGVSYYRRYERFGQLKDADAAIALLNQGISVTSSKDPMLSHFLNNLSALYRRKFEQFGDLKDIDHAIESLERVLCVGHELPSYYRPAVMTNLGLAYCNRFERLGVLEDIDRAIEYHAQSVALAPAEHTSRPFCLSNLAFSYQRRFAHRGELHDLENALSCGEQAIELVSDGHTSKPAICANLGELYRSRFERLGDLHDIELAVQWGSRAVDSTPTGHLDRPVRLHNLAASYSRRFERLGEAKDIDQAIEYSSQAVSLTSNGTALRTFMLSNLGASYTYRFRLLGKLKDIDQSVQYLAEAISSSPDQHAQKPEWLSNLGNSYQCRFQRLGEFSDIDMSIDHLERAIQLLSEGHAELSALFNNLGAAHMFRFERLGDHNNIDRAIECHTRSVKLTPEDDPDLLSRLANLGISFQFRFNQSKVLKDIDSAIAHLSEALSLAPDGHYFRPFVLGKLGVAYRSRFDLFNNIQDINAAIVFQTQAVSLTPEEHADKPEWLAALARSVLCQLKSSLSPEERARVTRESIGHFQMAAKSAVGKPYTRFRAACAWANLALQQGLPLSLQPYELAMNLIHQVVWLGTTVDQRLENVLGIGNISAQAAAVAISAQKYDLALEWLEEGHSIIWKQMLQLRTPFDEVAAVDSALAQSFKQVAHELNSAASQKAVKLPFTARSLAHEQGEQQHRRLAEMWDQLVAQARRIPQLQDFLKPKQANQLSLAAHSGVVAVINVHTARCDALVLRPGSSGVTHVPLPTFSHQQAVHAHRLLLEELQYGNTRERSDRGLTIRVAKKPATNVFQEVLAVLWDHVVKPVLAHLGYLKESPARDLPRITWCTSGPLSFLPLHAAGIYEGQSPARVFDYVVSSYTPTISALLPDPGYIPEEHSSILAVGQANAKGSTPLPGTEAELSAIRRQAESIKYTQLDAEGATTAAVLDAMNQHSSIHLACHAIQEISDPTESGFRLHDGMLSLATIIQQSHQRKGLAFLSACQTATGDEKFPDESVHLAAGMRMAGYSSVIATLWSIQDQDAPLIAEEVYARLLKEGRMNIEGTGRALHAAVESLRERHGDKKFSRWVPYVHIGL